MVTNKTPKAVAVCPLRGTVKASKANDGPKAENFDHSLSSAPSPQPAKATESVPAEPPSELDWRDTTFGKRYHDRSGAYVTTAAPPVGGVGDLSRVSPVSDAQFLRDLMYALEGATRRKEQEIEEVTKQALQFMGGLTDSWEDRAPDVHMRVESVLQGLDREMDSIRSAANRTRAFFIARYGELP